MPHSSQQPGITGWIATRALSSCSMTWNGESWLVIVSRGNGIVSGRGKTLPGALQAVDAALGAGESKLEAQNRAQASGNSPSA